MYDHVNSIIKLHITSITGPGNDCLRSMEDKFGAQMAQFYLDCNHFKGNTTGGDFTGKVLRRIISPSSLSLLSTYLGDTAAPYINYLDSLREIYVVCTNKKLDDDYSYEEKVTEFQQSFDEVNRVFNLSETTKVHILYSHVQEFISIHGHSMAMFSDEPIETCHGRLRFMERKHNFWCSRNLVSKYKGQRSKASFDMWNLKSIKLMDKTRHKKKKFTYW